MDISKTLIALNGIEHGFKHIMAAGDKIIQSQGMNHFSLASSLLSAETYQGRMLGTYLFGLLSVNDPQALKALESVVVKDKNWRVQEMLAKALDYYCNQIGYQNALPKINAWLDDKDPNLNRAVVEGLRIWTSRPYFNEHVEQAIEMISTHRASNSEYLRKSVGNALRDIWKKHPALVEQQLETWDCSDTRIMSTKKLSRINI